MFTKFTSAVQKISIDTTENGSSKIWVPASPFPPPPWFKETTMTNLQNLISAVSMNDFRQQILVQ